jgi:hypothetical protein
MRQEMEPGGDRHPRTAAFQKRDNEDSLADFLQATEVEFLADAESDEGEKDEYEKVKGVQSVVVIAYTLRKNAEQVQGIWTDACPAQQLSRDFRQAEAVTDLSAQIRRQHDHAHSDHLHRRLFRLRVLIANRNRGEVGYRNEVNHTQKERGGVWANRFYNDHTTGKEPAFRKLLCPANIDKQRRRNGLFLAYLK